MADSILIVDDDARLLLSLQRNLREEFDLVLAESGPEAIDAVERARGEGRSFAVAVCDLGLPGMGGIELLSLLKTVSPDTVRIALTGDSSQQAAIDAINRASVFRFFAKPCPIEQLTTGLREALGHYNQFKAESEVMESLGYEGGQERTDPVPLELFAGEPAPDSMPPEPVPDAAPAVSEPHQPTSAERMKAIQDLVGYDIVNHDRLLAIADHVWRKVVPEQRSGYSAKHWQAGIYEKCSEALKVAEKKLAETHPDPRLLRANLNILRSAFARQVIRAMHEVAEGYRARQTRTTR